MAVLTDTVIGAGEKIEFSEQLDLETYKDAVNKAVYLKAFITGESDDFKVNPDGYEVKIAK